MAKTGGNHCDDIDSESAGFCSFNPLPLLALASPSNPERHKHPLSVGALTNNSPAVTVCTSQCTVETIACH